MFLAIGFLVPLFGSLHQLARLALINGPLSQGVQLGGEEREIAAVFIDMAGFTPLSMAVAPGEVVRLLNRFFREVIEVVESERGMVNKFEGDAALCVFGAPVSRENPTVDALRAARSLASVCRPSCPRSTSASASRPGSPWPGTSAPSAASNTP